MPAFNLNQINFPIQIVIDWRSELGMLDVLDARKQLIASMQSLEAFKDAHILSHHDGPAKFLIKHASQPVKGDYFYDLMALQDASLGDLMLNTANTDHFTPNMALGYAKVSLASLIEKLSLDVFRNGQQAYHIVDSNKIVRTLRQAILIFDVDSDGILPAWLSTPSFVMTNHRKQKIANIKRPASLRKDAFIIDMTTDMTSVIPSHHHALVWCALLDHCYIQACIEMERY